MNHITDNKKVTITGISSFVLSTYFVTSCSHRLSGTWAVQRYEEVTPGKQGVALSNIGAIQFKSKGTGEKNINYTILGINKANNLSFKWNCDTGSIVSIESEGSDMAKTWIIITNKKKFQKWKSTDVANKVQIMEFIK